MEFTVKFIRLFFFNLELAAPLFFILAYIIIMIGMIVGSRESWGRFDSIYWAFITATTAGYGGIRPLTPLSKALAVLTAFIGIIFTGIMLSVTLNAATISFKSIYDISEIKNQIEEM